MGGSKRLRGTGLIFRGQTVLLVKDCGQRSYSLPGGRQNSKEAFLSTAVREIYEELGLRARRAERIYRCDYESRHNLHKVTLIDTDDDPVIQDGELCEFLWWDRHSDVPRFAHVDAILERYESASAGDGRATDHAG